MPRDTKTRFQGVYARHKTGCRAEAGERCSCSPSYWGKVWDRAHGRPVKTTMLPSASAASNARNDLKESLKCGVVSVNAGLRVKKAVEQFLRACEEGVALNKNGRRYKPEALTSLKGCLEGHVVPAIGSMRLDDVRRGDCQRLVDQLMPDFSGSRIRGVINSIRSLYRWAQYRDLVQHNPAALVMLPAMNATPRDRVATSVEMATLLDALEPADAVPYAIAVYTTARRAEIRHMLVEDVDLDLGVIYLGVDEHGRKSRAAQRAVPIVKPLAVILRRDLMRRGRPDGKTLLCPGHKPGGRNSGMLSFEALQKRADDMWEPKDEQGRPTGIKIGKRITPHECRHTCISWLDAAGVRPKVVSEIAGHATPKLQRDAAPITQERYTHTLPGDLQRAGELFDSYLTEQLKKASGE
jgi:integrase